jgi:AraC-like DNA-binding protein
MQAQGLDWRRSLADVGINPDIAVDFEAMIPLATAFELLENAARQSNNDAFGLQFAETLPANITGALAYVTLNAPNLRTLCNDSVRFLGLVAHGYTARFEEGPTLSHFFYDVPRMFGPRAQFMDMLMAAMAIRLRHVAQDPGLAIHIDIEHPAPRSITEFFRVLGRNVRFDCTENRLALDTRILSRPLPNADPQLYRIVRQHAQDQIERREKTQSLVYCVTDYIADALKHGDATLAEAAQTLGMSSRALQRELEKANTTFRDLVEDTRKSMARHFLYDTSLPLTEIAFMLGFSELSAFSRAARGWFGASPRELRKVSTERNGA